MASQTITADFTSQISVPGTDEILVVVAGVTGTFAGTVINAVTFADGRAFDIAGGIIAENSGTCLALGVLGFPSASEGGSITIRAGGRMQSDTGTVIAMNAQSVVVNNRGVLAGQVGIEGDMSGSDIINKGEIRATEHCVLAVGNNLEIINSGLLKSASGTVLSLEGNNIDIFNTGVIRASGLGAAIDCISSDGDVIDIDISGKLISQDIAFQGGAGDDRITVTGFVKGDIVLGEGSNNLDFKGQIDGLVVGGTGSDFYEIGKSKLTIIEVAGGSADTIRAKRDTILTEFIEDLALDGKADLRGTGNASGNSIFGNSGVNIIRGLGGEDLIDGDRGNDTIFLGADADQLLFNPGDGRDRVMDFVPGEDTALIFNLSFDDFAEVQAQLFNVKGGVELRDQGDRIFFKGLKADDFSESDFSI